MAIQVSHLPVELRKGLVAADCQSLSGTRAVAIERGPEEVVLRLGRRLDCSRVADPIHKPCRIRPAKSQNERSRENGRDGVANAP